MFKREVIADVGIFLTKKRYIMHILDIEGIKCNKYKYVGVEVVRSTMPKEIKPHVKGIVEVMLSTQDYNKTNDAIKKVYDVFKDLPIESISTISNLNNYEKSENKCDGFIVGKGVPHHAKASILYNRLIEKLELENKYEKIESGDKVRLLFVLKPNKFNIEKIAYKSYFPTEFKKFFEPDYDTIFDKIVFSAIERLYDNVKWQPKKPSLLMQTDIFTLFG
jgi:DNA polymerase elongation subunit (family B)